MARTTDPDSAHFEKALREAFDIARAAGKRREALVSMIALVQYELSTAHQGVYPSQDALELVMRAVIAILDPQDYPDWKKFILENIRPGVAGLLQAADAGPDVWKGYKWW